MTFRTPAIAARSFAARLACVVLAQWAATPALGADPPEARASRDSREPREPARVAVVPVIVAAGERPTASSIFAAVAAAARFRFDVELMTEEETFVSGSADLSDRVLDCGPDVRCIAGELRRLDARLAIVVVANLDLDPPLLGLQLIDCEEARVVAEVIDRLPAGTKLADAVTARAGELFDRSGYPMSARLIVRSDPPRAAIRVGDNYPPDRLAANTYTLRPGKYLIQAGLEGYENYSREVEVTAGRETTIEISLTENDPFWASPWLWIVAGVAVAGGVTAAIIATRPTDSYVCVPLEGVDCNP